MRIKTWIRTAAAVMVLSLAVAAIPGRTIMVAGAVPRKPRSPIVEIALASEKYGVSEKILSDLAICESSMRHEGVWGDNGNSYGIAQFQKPTWNEFNRKRGTHLDYYDMHDQIDMLAWAFANNLQGHWTCYWLINKLKLKDVQYPM